MPGIVLAGLLFPVVVGNLLHYYLVTVRSLKEINRRFSCFVAPKIVEHISEDPACINEYRSYPDTVLLFSDIADFTPLTERLPGKELFTVLDTYFDTVARVLAEELGVPVTQTGDGIFAIWGAPLAVDAPCERATQAALRIQAEIKTLIANKKLPNLKTRIGVNRGSSFTGTLGGRFTAIGDAANGAARIEQINKLLGTEILITESVAKDLPASFHLLPMGLFKVKGKTEALALKAVLPAALVKPAPALWRQGLQAWQARSWNEALRYFNETALVEPMLTTAKNAYSNRARQFIVVPPADDWMGEVDLTS